MSMDKIMSKAVEIGELLRETDACKRLLLSNVAFEADLELKDDIAKFEESRTKLMQMEQSGATQEEMEAQNTVVMDNYEKIMANPVMIEVTDAKQGVDEIITQVVRAIGSCIIESADNGCGGECAGCSGCN